MKGSPAQTPNWVWAKNAGGSDSGMGNCVAGDSYGNVYVTGSYNSPHIGFGCNSSGSNAGSADVFIVKYNSSGVALWVKTFGDVNFDYPWSIKADDFGNVYITGYFESPSIIFGSNILTNAGSADIFIVKLDTNGNVLWAKSAGGTAFDAAYSVSLDILGNVYITGFFQSSAITFGSFTLSNSGGFFLVKYDKDGNVVWANTASGGGLGSADFGYSLKSDYFGEILVTGYYNSPSITFGSDTLTNSGLYDVFIAKFDVNGNEIWARSAGGTGLDWGHSVAADILGNIYITGNFKSPSITFGNISLNNTGDDDIFIAKYGYDGDILWVKSASGIGTDLGQSLTIDLNQNVWLAGGFQSPTITFGSYTFGNSGEMNMFLAKYDGNGTVLWATCLGGSEYDLLNSVATDSTGNVQITGWFGSPELSIGSYKLKNFNSSAAVFIAKYSVSGNVLWATSAGGRENGIVSIDDSGIAYVAGSFDSPAIILGFDTLVNKGYNDIFLVKYDINGNALWAKSAGGTNDEDASSVVVDTAGDIYIIGYFEDTISFDSITLYSSGGKDIFLTKYNNNGNIIWAKSVGGSDNDWGLSLAVDASGSVLVTGDFESPTISFGSFVLTNASNDNMFIAKYNQDGNVQWARSSGGTTADGGFSVATDNLRNVYVAGWFYGQTLTFGSYTLTNNGLLDMFLVKYDETGNVLWATSAGGANYDYGKSVMVDNYGNSYLTGSFKSPTITFDSVILTNAGGYDVFFAKYNENGIVLWAANAGGVGSETGNSVAVDPSGSAYITGSFSSPTFLVGSDILVNNGDTDIFLMKCDANGNILWASGYGGTGSESGHSVAVNDLGDAYLTGSFCSVAIIIGNDTLTNTGGSDLFLSKFMDTNVGTKEFFPSSSSYIYPNPAINTLTISSPEGNKESEISIINIVGQELMRQKVSQPKTNIDISRIPSGIYFIKTSGGNFIETMKFIKK